MNLYFLSLIQPEKRKREKNLGVKYHITVPLGIRTPKKEEKYIKTRFPFLCKGDKIEFGTPCNRHGGYCSFFYNGFKFGHKIHNLGSMNPGLRIHGELTRKEKMNLMNSSFHVQTLKNKITNESYSTYISRLKIGKGKYTIFLFLECFWAEIPNQTLYTSTTSLYKGNILDQISSQNRKIMYVYST